MGFGVFRPVPAPRRRDNGPTPRSCTGTRGWHFSLKDTEHEDSSPAAPTGDPLSTASDGQDRRPANAEGIAVPGPGRGTSRSSIASRPAIRSGPPIASALSVASGPVIAVDAMGGD